MLQALVRNKARKFLVGRQPAESLRVPREDIMTDCVFGGCRYFDPTDAGLALTWILSSEIVPRGSELEDIELWPGREGCEPDAIIRLRRDGSLRTIVLEAKWGRNLLGFEQADRQWEIFGTPALAHGDALHLFVVEHRGAVEEDLIEAQRERRRVITRREIAFNLYDRRLEQASKKLHRWVNDVIAVLDEAGQRPFTGWTVPDLPVRALDRPHIFYPPVTFEWPVQLSVPQFAGGAQFYDAIKFTWPTQRCTSPQQSLFWLA